MRRVFNLNRFTLPLHFAGVRPGYAINHFHQRALARTVFTEHRVDFTTTYYQTYVFIGNHRRVNLGNAIKLESDFLFNLRNFLGPGLRDILRNIFRTIL
ncbi:hypothetical protein MnTg03_00077 [bacterium MnTg03]|nr:hypothetical protein MnTg03_00077 [bacterium MnTg03]